MSGLPQLQPFFTVVFFVRLSWPITSLLADHVSPGCLAHHIIRHQFIRVTQSYKNVPTLSRNKRWLKNNINGICTVLLQIWAVIHAFWYYNFWQIFNSVLGFHFLQLCLPASGCEPRAGLWASSVLTCTCPQSHFPSLKRFVTSVVWT